MILLFVVIGNDKLVKLHRPWLTRIFQVKSNANSMAKKIELCDMTLLDFKHALNNETRLSGLQSKFAKCQVKIL